MARDLYATGLSTRQVAQIMGCSGRAIADICVDILRDRVTTMRLRQPMQPSTHWRTCRAQARKIMERKLGRQLETWEDVHHKDEDYTNNADDNLEVLHEVDHAHVHHPTNPVPRHLRPERQAYMKRYFATYRKQTSAA